MSERIDKIYKEVFPNDIDGQEMYSSDAKVLLIKILVETELDIERHIKKQRGY